MPFDSGEPRHAERLRAAAQLIQQGWCRGRRSRVRERWFRAPVTEYCLEGAVATVYGVESLYQVPHPVWRAILRVTNGASPWRWNDTRGRTKAHVVAALTRAAELV